MAKALVWVCLRCGVRQQDDNPPFCWGCGYGETVATEERTAGQPEDGAR